MSTLEVQHMLRGSEKNYMRGKIEVVWTWAEEGEWDIYGKEC